MSYVRIEHYRFFCDAPGQRENTLCRRRSPIVAGENLAEVVSRAQRHHGWRIIMGQYKPLFTYCPWHRALAGDKEHLGDMQAESCPDCDHRSHRGRVCDHPIVETANYGAVRENFDPTIVGTCRCDAQD